MSKQIIRRYTFDPQTGKVTLYDFDTVRLERLALITHLPSNTILFNFADSTRSATVSGNVITLAWDTRLMSASDPLRIDYDVLFDDPAYDKVVVGNSRTKLRDSFATQGTQPNPATWKTTSDSAQHILTQGGNSSGSTYLRISLSPFVDDSGVSLTSLKTFKFPARIGYGVSVSQRIPGQEVFVGLTASDPAGLNTLDMIAQPLTDRSLVANASVTSNVATFTSPLHGLNGGDRVTIMGCVERRLNVGPVAVTIVDANTFTVPCTLANGTYSITGGSVHIDDPLVNARNSFGLLFENTTTTNASAVSRRNGAKFRTSNQSVASTTAAQSNTNPYTDAFNAGGQHEIYASLDEISWRSYTPDSTASMSGVGKYTEAVPDEDGEYRLHVRAKTLAAFTKPIARVIGISKSGSTTATVTTDVPHGLATTDFVQIYGVRDQTNFPNLTAQTAVASVPSSTTFTVVIGPSATVSSAGGNVWLVHGSVLAPGAFSQVSQSIARTNGILTVTGNASWATPLPGEYVHLHGLEPAAAAYEGAYKVLRASGTALELESPGQPDFSSITTGGCVIRRTDVRLHFARIMDYTRLDVEVLGGRGNQNDSNNAVPVTVAGSAPATQSTGSSGTIWNAAGWGGYLVNDIPSAAVTSTTTSGTITPGVLGNVGTYAHEFNAVVTAVSGTSPTLDLAVEESVDNGTNWVRIYEFPRITANGTYTSPLIRATFGTRFRYVRTVGGTSPSFTMSVNRIQFSSNAAFHRQFFDRSVVLTTLNSTTPVYTVDGATRFMMVVNVGAITTTAPALQLEGSEDGTNFYLLGSPLTAVASSTVQATLVDVIPKFVRARVSTAGAGVTAGYVSIKAYGA